MSEKPSHNHTRDRLRESLSATLDGEAGELELRRVLDRIGSDDELRGAARRYQMIGDVMRKESDAFMNVDLSSGIRDRLEQEGEAHKETSPDNRAGVITVLDNWWSSLGRVAVAASVAFAMVVGLRNYNDVQEVQTVAAVSDPVTLSQPLQISQGGYGASGILAGYNSRQHDSVTPEQLAQAQSVADAATRERFRAYALQHAEMTTMHSGQGMLSFARLTSFDAR
ncbi:MAG: sigma-E factor negative regulatory protein [Endozoicomonas sp.]